MAKIIISGGSGFIGQAVSNHLLKSGYDVVLLSRKPDAASSPPKVQWDGKTLGDWAVQLEGAEAVINLAGESISKHWSGETKTSIVESRLDSTRAIGEAIKTAKVPPQLWINASAIGYYGDRGNEPLVETSPPGKRGDFLVDTCVAWEEEQNRFQTPSTRKARLRTGVVLGKGGGAYEPLSKITQFFLGGHIGTGQQYVSWIHLDDIVGLITWIIKEKISGPVNGTAPNPVTNAELMHTLREVLHRPWAPPVPAFALQTVAALGGPEASLLLQGQRVFPDVALAKGYDFKYPQLKEALQALKV